MKQLHEYETPRVDECEMTPSLHLEDNVVYSDTARDLEQRLACAVEGFQKLYDALDSCVDLTPELLQECRETLNQIKQ